MLDNKTRVQIAFNDEILAKLNQECDRLGITKSAYVSMLVARELANQDAVMSMVESVLRTAMENSVPQTVSE